MARCERCGLKGKSDTDPGWQLATVSSTSPATSTSIFDCSSGTAAACAASGNELGFMYYHNLGGTGGYKTGTQTSVLGGQTLTGIRPDYWSGTEFDSSTAWSFHFSNGSPRHDFLKGSGFSAWAVHPGDVAAIPEPETYTMMLAGLGLMGFVARRRKRKAAVAA